VGALTLTLALDYEGEGKIFPLRDYEGESKIFPRNSITRVKNKIFPLPLGEG
jgi:hypothetical protein